MDYIRRVAVIANEERSKAKTKTTFNKVRAYYENHPSCTQKHVQRALNLSQYQVQNAVQKLRNQWKDK